MRKTWSLLLSLSLTAIGCANHQSTATFPPGHAVSTWVHANSSGRLVYQQTPRGDHVMDFSFAGYGGGGVAIPKVLAAITLSPSGGDDAISIQKAIDDVSQRPLVNGFRGAVLLAPGRFNCSAELMIRSSGVVLRGTGAGAHAQTVITLTGKAHGVLGMGAGGRGARNLAPSLLDKPSQITDTYVPSGTSVVHVADPSAFHAGDTIAVVRPITTTWVHFMEMDHLVRNGKPETWLDTGEITMRRKITTINGTALTLDVPLSDCIDASLQGTDKAFIQKYAADAWITNVGLEDLRVEAPPIQVRMLTTPEMAAARAAGESGEQMPVRAFGGIHLDGLTDAWVRRVQIVDTVGVVSLGPLASRITVEDVAATHTVATLGVAKPADFVISGSQALFSRCTDTGDNLFYLATQARVTGPNVLLDCTFHGNGHVQPHQRWATGLLVDNCRVPTGGIDFMDRGYMGSGHGWTTGWSGAWNCTAKNYQIDAPPGVMNWAIGCNGEAVATTEPGSGKQVPQGTFEAPGERVHPASLYLAQLQQRLGKQAVKNAGY